MCVMATTASEQMLPMGLADRIFAPAMLMLMLHLTPRLLLDGLAGWACDRGVLALVLCAAATVGYLGPVIRLLAVGLTVAGIVLPPRRSH